MAALMDDSPPAKQGEGRPQKPPAALPPRHESHISRHVIVFIDILSHNCILFPLDHILRFSPSLWTTARHAARRIQGVVEHAF
jgi:hypothetical protein